MFGQWTNNESLRPRRRVTQRWEPNSGCFFSPNKNRKKIHNMLVSLKILKSVLLPNVNAPDYRKVLCRVYFWCTASVLFLSHSACPFSGVATAIALPSCHKHKLAPSFWRPVYTVLSRTCGLTHWNNLSIFIQLERISMIPVSRHFRKAWLSHNYFLFCVLSCIVQLGCFLINGKRFLWILSCLS